MYLRYREPTWEAPDSSGAGLRNSTSLNGQRRRRDHGAAGSFRVREPVRTFPVIELNGVKLHAVTENQVVTHILDELHGGRGGVVVTPNLDHLRRYLHDLSFGALIAEADLVVADGMPLVWASRLQGTPLPERVPGSTLISTLSAAAGAQGRSVFLLGGDPGTADGAAAALKARFPSCVIAGTHFPPFGFQENPAQMSAIIQILADTKPDIVYVALGSPKQEKLIAKLRPVLPNSWWIGVGNSFSFLAGHVKRAPIWMQRSGLEWTHRLLQEPRRLFRRYLIVGVPFAAKLLSRSAVRGVPTRIRRMRGLSPAVTAAPIATLPPRKTPEELVAAETTARAALRAGDTLERSIPAPITASDTGIAAVASRLRGVVLLGGAVRASELGAAALRPVLDLPLDDRGSVLNHWLNHASDVARWAGRDRIPVRIKVNQNAPEPRSAEVRHYGNFRVERDLSDYRGTGGVLHDLAADYEDEDFILVANAAQLLLDPLASITEAMALKGGDITLVSHEDGTPSGIMLIKCKTLRLIQPRGFVDMKEQALPLIASKYDVRVLHRRRPTGLPVRSLSDYIQALRLHHREKSGRPPSTDPLAEDWGPSFSIIEEGAKVDPSARVHDSVVLRGARIEPGAIVVRGLVCPGGVVARDRAAVDRIVSGFKEGKGSGSRRSGLAVG
ncbi:MAG TPA: WecB/TagA/CpsF family glycosyltransferase [Tepidisphaeraceae bacterium]|nr:WecB/TagA/CpsF family glycosyltransferase [Tepidisphaeraceae bacterium]